MRFPVSGPLRYTMTAEDAVELLRPARARAPSIPIHYEGWKHFRQGRDAVERVFTASPLAERVHWLEAGTPTALTV